jgi:hypothetical protein
MTDSQIMLDNIYLGCGFTSSASWISEHYQNKDFVSLYQILHRDKEKERIWEEIRKDHFPNAPSRMGAIFLFQSIREMERACSEWRFGNRTAFRAIAIAERGSKKLVADARWLHTTQDVWKESACRYWSGDVSEDPLREVIVHGRIFCPDWQSPPFRAIKPRSP